VTTGPNDDTEQPLGEAVVALIEMTAVSQLPRLFGVGFGVKPLGARDARRALRTLAKYVFVCLSGL